LADTCTTPTFTNPQDTQGKIKGGSYTPLWGVISAKTSLEIWDIEITFGWSVMEAISLFEWSTSISKCKCSHLNGQLRILYPNVKFI